MPSNDEQGGIVLGPGNQVSNVPQNERLLALIEEAPVWETEKVLKLSQFLQAYPGNVPAGKHVALVALAMRGGQQAMEDALTDYWDELREILTTGDKNEDEAVSTAAIVADSPVVAGRMDMSRASLQLFYRRVPVNGIGLLVETFEILYENQVVKTQHFILGVAPAL